MLKDRFQLSKFKNNLKIPARKSITRMDHHLQATILVDFRFSLRYLPHLKALKMKVLDNLG